MGSLFGGGDRGAKEAAARAEASRVEAEKATQNMQANFATDLKQDNVGTVIAAGTASAADLSAGLLKRKKSVSNTLSAQLGINT